MAADVDQRMQFHMRPWSRSRLSRVGALDAKGKAPPCASGAGDWGIH